MFDDIAPPAEIVLFRTLQHIPATERLHPGTTTFPSAPTTEMTIANAEYSEPEIPKGPDGNQRKFTFVGLSLSSSPVTETRDVHDSEKNVRKAVLDYCTNLNEITDVEARDDCTEEEAYGNDKDELVASDHSKLLRQDETEVKIIGDQNDYDESKQSQLISADDGTTWQISIQNEIEKIIMAQGQLVDCLLDLGHKTVFERKLNDDCERKSTDEKHHDVDAHSEKQQDVDAHSEEVLAGNDLKEQSETLNPDMDCPSSVHDGPLKVQLLEEAVESSESVQLLNNGSPNGDEATKRTSEQADDVIEKSCDDACYKSQYMPVETVNETEVGAMVNEIVTDDAKQTIEVCHVSISSDTSKSSDGEFGAVVNTHNVIPEIVSSPTPPCMLNFGCYFAPVFFTVEEENKPETTKIDEVSGATKVPLGRPSTRVPISQIVENPNESLQSTVLTEDAGNTTTSTAESSSASTKDQSVKLDESLNQLRIEDLTCTEDVPFDEAPMVPKPIVSSRAHSLAFYPLEFRQEMQKTHKKKSYDKSPCLPRKQSATKPIIKTLAGIKATNETNSKYQYDFTFSKKIDQLVNYHARALVESLTTPRNGCCSSGEEKVTISSPKEAGLDKTRQVDTIISDLSPGSARNGMEETMIWPTEKNEGPITTDSEKWDENLPFGMLLDFWKGWDKPSQPITLNDDQAI